MFKISFPLAFKTNKLSSHPILFCGNGYILSFILVILLSSCASQPCREWEIDTITTCPPYYNCTRMTLASENLYSGLKIELVETISGLRMYANMYSLPIEENLRLIPISVAIAGCESQREAFLLRGGQRLLFPEDLMKEIILALETDEEVKLAFDRYKTTLTSRGFKENYRKLTQTFR